MSIIDQSIEVLIFFVGAVFFVGGITGKFKDYIILNKKWEKTIFAILGSVYMIITLVSFLDVFGGKQAESTEENKTEKSEVNISKDSTIEQLNESEPKETSTTKDSIKKDVSNVINKPESNNTQTEETYTKKDLTSKKEKKETINSIDIQFNELLTKFESKEFDCKDIKFLVKVYMKKFNKSEKKGEIVQIIIDFEKEIDTSKLIDEERLEMEDCILAINNFKDSI